MRNLLYYILVFFLQSAVAQSNSDLSISFVPVYENTEVTFDETPNQTFGQNQLQVTTFKWYISQIELYQKDQLVYSESNSYHLLDASDPSSLQLLLTDLPKTASFTHIQFNLGIDSLTNVSGAMGGDLDPSKGMYWTWQSDYINFKLEGRADDCPTRNQEFQFHIGGYQHTANTLRKVKLACNDNNPI